MKYTHTHHIVPRHAGGTDHPDNLVELTPLEHADAHNLLYSMYKRPEDKLAELCLLGQAKDPDAVKLKAQLGGFKTGKRNGLRNVQSGHLRSVCKLGGQAAMKLRVARGDDFGASWGGKKRPDHGTKVSAKLAGVPKTEAHKAAMAACRTSYIRTEDGVFTTRQLMEIHNIGKTTVLRRARRANHPWTFVGG